MTVDASRAHQSQYSETGGSNPNARTTRREPSFPLLASTAMFVETMSAKPPSLKTRINRLNRDLANLTRNTYFKYLPVFELGQVIERHGFEKSDMQGIYCGHSGQSTHDLGENVWMNVSWYRMESGNYEVMVYASKGTNR